MNENTTIDWVENVLKTFTFGKRRLFAWDSFRAHLVQSLKELLNKRKIDPVVILLKNYPWWINWTYSSVRQIMKQAYKRSTERNVRTVNRLGTPHTYFMSFVKVKIGNISIFH